MAEYKLTNEGVQLDGGPIKFSLSNVSKPTIYIRGTSWGLVSPKTITSDPKLGVGSVGCYYASGQTITFGGTYSYVTFNNSEVNKDNGDKIGYLVESLSNYPSGMLSLAFAQTTNSHEYKVPKSPSIGSLTVSPYNYVICIRLA